MLDLDGHLVGINTAIFSKTGGYQGIGFAIPAEVVKANSEQILDHKKIVRGWIGVIARPIDNDIAAQLHLANIDGAVIVKLYQGQPAPAAGLQPGDVVTAVSGKAVHNPGDLLTSVSAAKINSDLTLRIVRDGKTSEVKCQVAQRPESPDGQPLPGT
jgi:S1-C subfamily serine protease